MLIFGMVATSISALYIGQRLRGRRHHNRQRLIDKLQPQDNPKQALSETSHKQRQLPSLFSDGVVVSDNNESHDQQIDREIDQHLMISLSTLGLSTIGALIYPPLSLLSLPGLVYVFLPWFKDGYNALVKERKLRMAVVDMILITGVLLSRLYVAGALLATMISLSKKLLRQAEARSQKKIVNVFYELPQFVWLLRDGVEVKIPLDDLGIDDIVVVQAGQAIPVDGIIVDGQATVDQRILTGEAEPAEKTAGETVFALTVVLAGRILIKVEKAGPETVAAQIGNIFNQTSNYKNLLQWQWMEFVDRTAFPALMAGTIALPLYGPSSAFAVLEAGAFAYNMRIIAPVTLLNFLNVASKNSILIKDGRSLELLSKIDTVVFDKTGTLTEEKNTLKTIHTFADYTEDELLIYAATAEYKQTHPIAKAIQQAATERGLNLLEVEQMRYEIGYGLKVQLPEKMIRVGSVRFMEMEGIEVPAKIVQLQEASYEEGFSIVCVAINDKIGGVIELHPTIRPEAKQMIQALQQYQMALYIISGDHEKPTQKLAETLGIEHYFAETLPENKASIIEQLQNEGKCVCFVGDGINDAIALKKANVSISLRGASTIATDAAQIVLMTQNLKQLIPMFRIAHDYQTTMKNSFWLATAPNIITIGGILFLHVGLLTSLLLFYIGMGIGVGNSLLSTRNYQIDSAEDGYIEDDHSHQLKE